MVSQVDIFNLAISRIGISQQISTLDERTEPRRQCSRWYEHCRDQCLRNFSWGFARKAVQLAELDQTFPGWGFVYDYPNDCVMALEIIPEDGNRWPAARWFNSWHEHCYMQKAPRYPWQRVLRTDEQAQAIVTDLADAWLMYIAKVTVTTIYDPDFVEMLAWRLAAEVGAPLNAKTDMVANAWRTYELMRLRAAANDFNESYDDPEPDAPSIQARW